MLDGRAGPFLPSCSSVMPMNESVGERHLMYRLGESEVFEYINKSTTVGGLKIVDVIPRMVVTDHGFLRLELSRFDKNLMYELFDSGRFKMKCKKELRAMLDAGDVVLVYSSEYKLPTCIPYIIQNKGTHKNVIYANVSDFVEVDDFGVVKVGNVRNYNALMSVIFAAAVILCITNLNTVPADLTDGMSLSYASMFEAIINAIVHCDPIAREKTRYLATKFSLVQMFGTTEGLSRFTRIKAKYFPKLTTLITDTMDDQFKEDSFDKLSLFIDELQRLYPSMKGLSEYMIYDRWIRRYGASTMLSLDYLGYHVYTICMVLMESPLITRMALEPILEKSKGSAIYERMQHLISNYK